MRPEYQLLAAVLLDAAIGDPRRLPHPVRGVGRLALWLEPRCRSLFRRPGGAGAATAVTVIVIAGTASWGALYVAARVHPVAADALGAVLIYFTIAPRDLAGHSAAVCRALGGGDLPRARRLAGRMVGRDTAHLDEPGVVRAAVESVAEGMVDGVTAPLLYAAVFGPVGAVVYRAVNTLDSTFGYRTSRYAEFGRTSARLDDLAGFIPARLTSLLVPVAAAVTGGHPLKSIKTLMRDGGKHSSPNAGLIEAAAAGALGVQLGGLNHYFGEPSPRPTIGEPYTSLERKHIGQANHLMIATSVLFLAACIAGRMLLTRPVVWP